MIKKDQLVKVLCNKWGCNWVRQKSFDITREVGGQTYHASLKSRDPSGFKEDEVRKILTDLKFNSAQITQIMKQL